MTNAATIAATITAATAPHLPRDASVSPPFATTYRSIGNSLIPIYRGADPAPVSPPQPSPRLRDFQLV